MIVLPVIARELRAESRNPYNYWLRVMAAGVAMAIFAVVCWDPSQSTQELGGRLFGAINGLVFYGICLLTPVLTADCLSREKREGTLGLLFLTPLTALGIVTAKSLIHGLRSVSLVLVILPVSAAVFLLGGVAWHEVLVALMLNMDALTLGLGAGILASAMSRNWPRAVVLALLIYALTMIGCWLFFVGRVAGLATGVVMVEELNWFHAAVFLLTHVGSLAEIVRAGVIGWNIFEQAAGEASLAALLVFWAMLRLAARTVRISWQDESLTRRQLKYLEVFCTPRYWQSRFKSRMRAALDTNPIGWLHQYSWSARLGKWSWCLACIAAETVLVLESYSDFEDSQAGLMGILLIGMSFSAANSFIRERRSGAMELILVSPLSVRQIIFGRIKGVWSQFVPAMVMLVLSIGLGITLRRDDFLTYFMVYFASSFVIIPVVGLYYSLRQKTFIAAWLLTGCLGLGTPLIAGYIISGGLAFGTSYVSQAFGMADEEGPSAQGFLAIVIVVQWALAFQFGRWLKRKLDERTFAVNLS